MDNQNNNNINNTSNINTTNNSINQQTTTLPNTEVNTTVTMMDTTNISNNNQNQNVNNNSNTEVKKDGCFKYLLAFIFLIGIILFVIFLPDITKFIESKKNSGEPTNQKVQNGTMLCTMTKANDTTSYDYEMKMTFSNEKLGTTKFTTKIESYDNKITLEKKQKCDKASEIAKTIDGLDIECRLNDTVMTTIENYDLKVLNTNKLSSYTQEGGTYPEFEYEKNIYDIKISLTKEGYDCKISSSNEN